MQIEMIQGKTYVDMRTGKVFTSGESVTVDDETGNRLLQQLSASGIPFFRASVPGVKPVKAPTYDAPGSKPADRLVEPTESARAARRAGGTGAVKFGSNKARTGAPAGQIEPPEDGGVAV